MSLERRCIAVIEDDPVMGESLVQRLRLEGATARWWRTGADACAAPLRQPFDAIVCDIRLPDMDGEDVLKHFAASERAPPMLFITGYGDVDQAVRLMRAGAADYMTKPFDIADFLGRLAGVLHPAEADGDASDALGVSPGMRKLAHIVQRVAPLSVTVLVGGETGSGKEVVARYLHSLSPYATKPFMAVNCAAIPAHLMESELLGHERGAFTGADRRHLGYAERAKEGVLFLDEIADLQPVLQAKLLRLLEQRVFTRVGGEVEVPFRARVVAATNADLSARVRDGRFRDDLYYRLAVVTLDVPPLRDRPDDILQLLSSFAAEAIDRTGARLRGVSSLTEAAALAHAWPGNIRELRNRVERAVAMALGELLQPSDLFPEQAPSRSAPAALPTLEEARDAAERLHIVRALEASGGEVGAAARLLAIGRTTLWEKMRKLRLAAE